MKYTPISLLKMCFLLIFISFFLNVSFASNTGTTRPSFIADTLILINNEGKIVSPKETKEYLQTNNTEKLGELFYSTGYHMANKVNPSIQTLESALVYLGIANYYLQQNNNTQKLRACVENQATIQYELSNYEKSISLFQKAIQLYAEDATPNISQIGNIESNIGFIFFNTFRYENAIRYFSKALEKYTQTQDTLNISKALYNKGMVFYELNQLDSTLYYYEQALRLDKLLKSTDEVVASYNNIAIVLTKKHNFNAALDLLHQAQNIIEKLPNNTNALAIQSINFGNIFYYKKNYSKALEMYENALQTKRSMQDNEGIAICLHNIANVYMRTNKHSLAKNALHEALSITESIFPNILYGAICKTSSELYEILKDGEKALYYYELYVKNTSSILTEQPEQISEFRKKHEDGKFIAASIQREIKMQEMMANYDLAIKKKSLQTLEQQRKADKTKIALYISLLIFIVAAFFILLNRYTLKKRASLQLEQKNQEIAAQNTILASQAEELRKSNDELEKLSIVASKTDNAILIMDNQGYFEWVNEAYTNIFGYTFDELCSTISPHMISANTPEYIKEKYNYCISTKQAVQYELESKNKSKEPIWVQATLTPILNESGNIHRLVMIDADITNLKKAEQEIIAQKEQIIHQKEEQEQQRDYVLAQSKEIESQKEQLAEILEQLQATQSKLIESEKMAALGGLVAGISHEINTPVGVGTAASSSLAARLGDIIDLFQSKKMKLSDLQSFLETANSACELILKNLNRTAELVKSFNQVSVDNMTEEKRVFNVHEYLQDIARSLAPKFKGRQIQLSISCDSSIRFKSYPGAFAQIFTNFIINSLIHAYNETDAGEIEIVVTEQDSAYIMEYKDNGKGIPPENQAHVFEAFFTTNTQEGTGLGMNITYNLVTQKLGGDIQLWSEINKGVIFTITLPKANMQE